MNSGKEISLSVEETNRLRASLGLRPLRVNADEKRKSDKEKKPPLASSVHKNSDAKNVEERIKKARQRRIENSIFASRSIAESALRAEGKDEDENLSEEDVEAWVEKMRQRRTQKGPVNSRQTRKAGPGVTRGVSAQENLYSAEDLAGIKVGHNKEELWGEGETILTLRDASVLPGTGGMEEDVLENVALRAASTAKSHAHSADLKYDPTDNAEFNVEFNVEGHAGSMPKRSFYSMSEEGKDHETFRLSGGKSERPQHQLDVIDSKMEQGMADLTKKGIATKFIESAALGEVLSVQNDYVSEGEHGQQIIRQRRKKDGKSKKRKKSKSSASQTLQGLSILQGRDVPGEDGDSRKQSKLSHVSSVRSKARDRVKTEEADDQRDEEEEDQIFYSALNRARQKANDSAVTSTVDRILSAIDKAESAAADGSNQDDEAAAQLVFDEMEQYVRNIAPQANSSAPSDSEETDNSKLPSVFNNNEENEKDGDNDVKTAETNDSLQSFAKDSVKETPVESERFKPLSEMGVAAALARFRTLGELKQRPDQLGRARDEKVNWKKLDSTVKVLPGQRPVKLVYTDESGHELTPKEAFRQMCHRFHGKGPSKNKRETRLRNHLRRIRLQSISRDDTPLGASSALKAETRRTGSAHVVLSGSASVSAAKEIKPAARELQGDAEIKTSPAEVSSDLPQRVNEKSTQGALMFSLSGVSRVSKRSN